MARLTEQDVTRLLASLSSETGQRQSSSHEAPAHDAIPESDVLDTQQRLRELSSDGTLGPLLTQRLAAYLARPVRCKSGDIPALAVEGPLYVARGGAPQLWLRLDAVLASAIADAMIGGDGEAPKVGYGSKVARVAAGAATEMLRVIGAALHLPEPAAATMDLATAEPSAPAAGGSLSVATDDYGWQAGVVQRPHHAEPHVRSTLKSSAASTEGALPLSASVRPVSLEPASLDEAIDGARRQLEEMLGASVTFEPLHTVATAMPRLPHGGLRMSLASRGGGAIVLAIDRDTAAALVNCSLQADVVAAESGGALMEAGAEVLVRGALHAFAAALAGSPEELYHIERLSDEAMLAELPHLSIEHRVQCGRHAGALLWLVPERMLRPRLSTGGDVRGKL